MIYFTSDNHYFHENVIKYSNRPFKNADEMNEVMIENHNNLIKASDIVYFLGDFALARDSDIKNVLRRLNGRKKLVFGNHDHALEKHRNTWGKDFFESMEYYDELKEKDSDAHGSVQRIVLCHYSMRVWNKSHYGAWNVYGHSHGTLEDPVNLLSIDAGVDAVAFRLAGNKKDMKPEYYRPISYDEVKAHMKKKKWKPVDHHGEDGIFR